MTAAMPKLEDAVAPIVPAEWHHLEDEALISAYQEGRGMMGG